MTQTDAWNRAFAGPALTARPMGEPVRVVSGGRQSSRRSPNGQQHDKNKRLDIQGLRMIAVVAVFVNHVSGHPKGAFTGVDVFFVISGFLITGLLVRDASREKISVRHFFTHFYERRARRILPAALTVLIVSWVAANLTFKGARVTQAHTDILYSLGFVANIHYANIGTDYFQQNSAASITQHFWSLAVEEQFYFIWPIVVLFVLAVLGRRTGRSLNVLLGVISLLTVISFVYSVRDTTSSPTTAYFSTFARAWELGVGAILAVLLARFPKLEGMFGRASGPLILVGVAAIITSFFIVDSGTGFPAPWGAVPVLATGFVILVGPVDSAWVLPITNRASQYLGEISYSLYLWHWPTIVIVGALMPDHNALYYVIVVTAALGLSALSFEFIETPLRTSRQNRLEGEPRHKVPTAVIAAASLVVAFGGYAFKPTPTVPDLASPVAGAASVASTPHVANVSASLKAAIASALQRDRFPKLSPGLDELGLAPAQSDWKGCNTATTFLASCTFEATGIVSTHPEKVMLVGDSMMLAWMPAIKRALPASSTVYGFSRQLCAASYVSWTAQNSSASTSKTCDLHHAALKKLVNQVDPDLIIMSSATEILTNLKSGATGAAAIAQYRNGMIKTDQIVRATGRTVITLSPPPPRTKSLTDCDSTVATPNDCVTTITSSWYRQSTADAAAARLTGTRYIDTHLWFCSSNGYCPSFVANTPMFYDTNHITKAYAELVAPELAAVVRG